MKLKLMLTVFGFVLIWGCSKNEGRTTTIPRTTTCVEGQCPAKSENVDAYLPSADSSGNILVKPSADGAVIPLTPCSEIPAPLSACSAAAKVTILKPKHLGCSAPGTHAWLCYDSFSGPPPYPVVGCNGPDWSSCKLLGNTQ